MATIVPLGWKAREGFMPVPSDRRSPPRGITAPARTLLRYSTPVLETTSAIAIRMKPAAHAAADVTWTDALKLDTVAWPPWVTQR